MDGKKSVVISGYYGFNNIGDEAVLSSIVSALRKEEPTIEITVLSQNPSQTKAFYGVNTVNRWKVKEIAKAIKASDLVISGGGSLLQDVTSSKVIPYYLGVVKIAQWYKKPVVFYSQGVGPVSKGFSKKLIKSICNKVNHIYVREEGSKALLESIGVKKAPITVAIDPVLGIEAKTEIVDKVKAILPEGPKVGFYIRPWKEDNGKIIEAVAAAVSYVEEKGYKAYLIPMYYEEDVEIAKQIVKKAEGKGSVIDHEMTIDEVVAYTTQFDFIVGMRLHSLIMAHAVEVPMVALSYDPKVEGFVRETSLPYCITLEKLSSETLKADLDKLMEDLPNSKQRIQDMNKEKKQKVKLPAETIKHLLG